MVILTGHGSIDSAVRTNMLGSHVYLQKPCETEELLQVLKDAYQKHVQSKLRMDIIKIEQFLKPARGESPLAILRRLKELDKAWDQSANHCMYEIKSWVSHHLCEPFDTEVLSCAS